MNVFQKCHSIIVQNKKHITNLGLEAIKRFQTDILMSQELERHPFILTTNLMFQTRNHCVRIVNQCGKQSLKMLMDRSAELGLRKSIKDPMFVRPYLAQISTAIDFLHGKGFLLRYINPDSLLIDPVGHVCITDLSMVIRVNQVVGEVVEAEDPCLPPEVFEGQDCNYSTDFYALGVVGYYLLMEGVLPGPYRPLQLSASTTPEKMIKFLESCLVREVEQRPFQAFDDIGEQTFLFNSLLTFYWFYCTYINFGNDKNTIGSAHDWSA